MTDFSSLFKTQGHDIVPTAELYMRGLFTEATRKNMEVMDRRLGGSGGSYQTMQQFITDSPWSATEVCDAVAQRASGRIGDNRNTTLVIDESCHTKKGEKSCGVARQYNGRLGKQDNCQVGVYSALNLGNKTALVGASLYLPEEWSSDPERCRKAGVPEERIKQGQLGKIGIARQLVDDALRVGVSFACVAFDGFYGRDSGFRMDLSKKGLVYCADVPKKTNLFGGKPEFEKRPREMGKHALSAQEMGKAMMNDPGNAPHTIQLRNGENGPVVATVWAQRVWEWPPEAEEPYEIWLLVRQMGEADIKYSLCNAPAAVSIRQLATWQGSRFYVERTFQDAKSHAGMSQYQCRGWRAWHHHMAMVCLATLFIMEERLANPMKMEMLSAHDVVEMLDWAFTRHRTQEEVVGMIKQRHRQRSGNQATAKARATRRRPRRSDAGEGSQKESTTAKLPTK